MKSNKKLILASASPRRQELMKDIGCPFECIPSNAKENLNQSLSIDLAIEQIAYDKAKDVFMQHPQDVVVGCDTMVVLNGIALGKPKDEEDAKRMLRNLSGKTHQVITGVAIVMENEKFLFHEVTNVTFYDLNENSINAYIETGESMDKAGSYGIQGYGKILVKGIQGDYFNVVGLPVARLYRELKRMNVLDFDEK